MQAVAIEAERHPLKKRYRMTDGSNKTEYIDANVYAFVVEVYNRDLRQKYPPLLVKGAVDQSEAISAFLSVRGIKHSHYHNYKVQSPDEYKAGQERAPKKEPPPVQVVAAADVDLFGEPKPKKRGPGRPPKETTVETPTA